MGREKNDQKTDTKEPGSETYERRTNQYRLTTRLGGREMGFEQDLLKRGYPKAKKPRKRCSLSMVMRERK